MPERGIHCARLWLIQFGLLLWLGLGSALAAGVPVAQLPLDIAGTQRLDLSPEQVIHVGDSQEDVEGALGAGIRPVWIDRNRRGRWQAPADLPVRRISGLPELLELLD